MTRGIEGLRSSVRREIRCKTTNTVCGNGKGAKMKTGGRAEIQRIRHSNDEEFSR